MIKIEKRGNRIEVYTAEPLAGFRTAIPGAYFTSKGFWTVPLSLESCKLLQFRYGKRLKVGKELERWANGVKANRASMKQLASSDDAKLHVLPKKAPKLARAMRKRKYQRVGVRFVADNTATLVADEPGLGKTLIAMGGILEAEVPGPYLVVTPKTATEAVWATEITRWLPPSHRAVTFPDFRYQRERRLRLTNFGPRTWVIIHPEMAMVQAWWICQLVVNDEKCLKRTVMGNSQQTVLSCGHMRNRKTKKLIVPSFPDLFKVDWGAIVIDECHESLIRRKGTPTQRRRGLDLLKQSQRSDGIRLAMSGTPFDSKPHQLWGVLNWLDDKTHSAFYRWAQLFWEMGGYSGYEVGKFIVEREKLLWDSLSAISIRRTKAEVAKDLPPKMDIGVPLDPSNEDSPIGIWLEMEGKQKKAYQQLEETSIAQLDSGRLEAIYAIEELTRLKQLACCYGKVDRRVVDYWNEDTQEWERRSKQFYTPELPSNKFDWITENLDEWGFPGKPLTKVVIVSFYSGILRTFARGLNSFFKVAPGQLVTGITGRTPMKKRKPIIDEFNTRGGPQIMMLNVRAGGTAITIDSADRMIFISETRNPAQQLQAEDRIHRISNPRHCMYYYLRSIETVDIGTAIINQELIRDAHRLLDTRRGVDYVRHVLDLSRPFS